MEANYAKFCAHKATQAAKHSPRWRAQDHPLS